MLKRIAWASMLAGLWLAALPPAARAEGGKFLLRAEDATAADDLRAQVDNQCPQVEITSPQDGSTLAGDTVTVSGTVLDGDDFWSDPDPSDPKPVFDEVAYRLWREDLDFPVEGRAPVIDGTFRIPELALVAGWNWLQVFALDGALTFEGTWNACGADLGLVSDPDAPAIALVDPLDGEALLVNEVPIALNLGTAVQILTVNGEPDGRTLGPGLVPEALRLALLEPGPHPVQIDYAIEGGEPRQFAFTLFRVDSLGTLAIREPAQSPYLTNQTSLWVRGTLPLGTPYVSVNGIPAPIADDGVHFEAEVPIREGSNTIAARDTLNRRATVTVVGDFRAPRVTGIAPASGTRTPEAEQAIAVLLSEAATVTASGPGGSVQAEAIRDFSFGCDDLFCPEIYRASLPPLALVDGDNTITLEIRDLAGNETQRHLDLTRTEGVLRLASPSAGAQIPALRTALRLEALAPVTIAAVYSGALRIPAYDGLALGVGTTEVSNFPLQPGANAIRIVHAREGAAPETLAFELVSTASDVMTLTGRVQSEATGEALSGAFVQITVNGRSVIAYTDALGVYSATVEAGDATLSVLHEGALLGSGTASGTTGSTQVVDFSVGDVGSALANAVRIEIPPEGTVTDFDKVTVVGSTGSPQAQVSVNGVSAEVIGRRFTARGVPLALGTSTLEARAVLPGLPPATHTRAIERAETPVLSAKLFSPPEGALLAGGGFVLRGFVSAKNARVFATGGFGLAEEGVFEIPWVALPEEGTRLALRAELPEGAQQASDELAVALASPEPALRLVATPASGTSPLAAQLEVLAQVEFGATLRIDFDTDGDGVFDQKNAPPQVEARYTGSGERHARVVVSVPEGVEYAAQTRLYPALPEQQVGTLASGNPVDLIDGTEGDFFVLDRAAGLVRRYDREGSPLGTIGSPGLGAANLLNPSAIALGDAGELFVLDAGNDRLQVFEIATGNHLESIALETPGLLAQGVGLAVVEGRVAVSTQDGALHWIARSTQKLLRSFPASGARGLNGESGESLLAAVPAWGLQFAESDGLRGLKDGAVLSPDGVPLTPIDVEPGALTAVVDAAGARVVLLDEGRNPVRATGPLDPPPLSALYRGYQEVPTLYVADGQKVRKIELPVESPLPAVENLKARLVAGDVDGALALIFPTQRPIFEQIYRSPDFDIAADAQAMERFTVQRADEDSAVVLIHRTRPDGKERSHPVTMVRAPDGTWLVYDY